MTDETINENAHLAQQTLDACQVFDASALPPMFELAEEARKVAELTEDEARLLARAKLCEVRQLALLWRRAVRAKDAMVHGQDLELASSLPDMATELEAFADRLDGDNERQFATYVHPGWQRAFPEDDDAS